MVRVNSENSEIGRLYMRDINKIGNSIRKLRKQQNLTLLELAAKTNLSVGYLSNVERNAKSPTLVKLQKICEVLNTSLGDLLDRNAEERVIIRRDDREITVYEENNTIVETIEFGEPYGSYLYMTIEPNSSFEGTAWTHKFSEVGTVLSGKLSVDVDGEFYHLNEGDTILIRANSRHRCYNNSDNEPVVTYWARHWPAEEVMQDDTL